MNARPDTATIVFTDLVGSTELRSALGEELADALQREHDRLLNDAVEANGGRVVKSLGDGIMAAFGAASDAVAASVAIQVAAAAYSESPRSIAPLRLRVGASTGDVSWDDSGDCFGTPVIEAARLEAAAEPGQILCSDLTRLITRGRGGFDFEEVGSLDLKGLPEPLPSCEVRWTFTPGADEPIVPIPGPLVVAPSDVFVGRSDELLALVELDSGDDREGRLGVACLLGEPGIGKTRLAAEFAGLRHETGVITLFGRCEEDLQIPFRPIVEALNYFIRHVPTDQLIGRLGPDPAQLGVLCPDVWSLVAGLERPVAGSPELEQLRLFEAVRGWLAENRLLLVIDDLQWASRPTLQLLRHLLRSGEPSKSTIVATVRDVELSEDLGKILDDAALTGSVRTIALSGLTVGDLERLAAGRPDAGVGGEELFARSGGNPFFVRALLEDAAAGGSETADAAVRRRVQRIPLDARDCLVVGALLGLEFDLGMLAATSDLTDSIALETIEVAVDARLIREVAPNTFCFAHALVRDAILQQLGDTRRIQLHRRIGQVLAAASASSPAEVAHHLSQAAVDDASRFTAADWHERAAAQAEAQAAFGDAVRHLRRGAALLRGIDEERSLYLEVESFRVSRETGEYSRAAVQRLTEISDEALALGFLDTAVRGLLEGFHVETSAAVDSGWVHDRLDAMDLEAIEDDSLRAQALVWLPTSLVYSDRELPTDIDEVISKAVDAAEAVGDLRVLAFAHQARAHAIWVRAPHAIDEQVSLLELATGLSQRAGSLHDAAHHAWLLNARQIEAGDVVGARQSLEPMRSYADIGDNPWAGFLRSGPESILAFVAGDLEEAQRWSTTGEDLSVHVDGIDASGGHGQQMFAIRREQDRLEELRPMVEIPIRRGASMASMWRPGAAALFADLGMRDLTSRQLELLVSDDGPQIPVDSRYTTSLSFLADACVATEDVLRASIVREALLPYAGLAVVMPGITCFGPVDRYIARLSAVTGNLEDAAGRLEAAHSVATKMESPLFEAQVLVDMAWVADHVGDESSRVRHAAAALDVVGDRALPKVTALARALQGRSHQHPGQI